MNGISLNGIFHVTGGTAGAGGSNIDEILAWDSESEKWAKVFKQMKRARSRHAVTPIRYADMEKYGIHCD